MTLSINIIGAGRLGKSIAKLINLYTEHYIQGICNSSLESSIQAKAFIGTGDVFSDVDELPPADVTLITTNDANISKIAKKLSESEHLKNGSIILHCCGALPSDILEPLKARDCKIGSVHPMRTFSDPTLSVAQFKGTFCAIEGDPELIPFCKDLFSRMGGITYTIDKKYKSVYHASAVVAANYVVTLAHIASTLLESAGVQKELTVPITVSMMKSAINNLASSLNPESSLTGPIKRGDFFTIAKHMKSLPSKEMKDFYSLLGLMTIKLAKHSPDVSNLLYKALFNPDSTNHEPSEIPFMRSKL